jgi:protein TonB
MLMAAILLSLGLHLAIFGLLPSFLNKAEKLPNQLTVEFQPPPPPKPLPPPEPPKPEPEKPKPLPKKTPPPPKPLPVIQHQAETAPPPPSHFAEPPPQAVIAVAPKPSEPTPAVSVPSPQVESPPKTIAPPPDLEVIRSNYGSVLSREFAKYKQYPRVAQMRGWQGTSRVELQIDATGTVTAVNIVESSGFEVLDKQAIESVRKALPLPPIPAELRGKEFTIVVPMKFSLQ